MGEDNNGEPNIVLLVLLAFVLYIGIKAMTSAGI